MAGGRPHILQRLVWCSRQVASPKALYAFPKPVARASSSFLTRVNSHGPWSTRRHEVRFLQDMAFNAQHAPLAEELVTAITGTSAKVPVLSPL